MVPSGAGATSSHRCQVLAWRRGRGARGGVSHHDPELATGVVATQGFRFPLCARFGSLAFVVVVIFLFGKKKKECRRSQDGRTAWKLFVCLTSMKYSQTNTKPSYTPRKPTGRLTQQSAQPEPQNSAGMRHEELNLGSKKPRKIGNHFCGQREDGNWGAGGNTGKAPLPKSSRNRVGSRMFSGHTG